MVALSPTTTYPAIVGQLLAKYRGEREMTQADLARAMGMNQSAWSKIERGVTPPTLEHLAGAADVLHVPLGRLLTEADLVAEQMRAQGITVSPKRLEPEGALGFGLLLIGAVTLGSLVAAILASASHNKDEPKSAEQ
jgi:transcriptional regulator with XRE-family HTH domain